MLEITKARLHAAIIEDDDVSFSDEERDAIKAAVENRHIVEVIADFSMSELRLGSESIVDIAQQVADLCQNGYMIATWYGPKTEALVVGYKPEHVLVIN